jgi:hypothetical protein
MWVVLVCPDAAFVASTSVTQVGLLSPLHDIDSSGMVGQLKSLIGAGSGNGWAKHQEGEKTLS